MFKGMSFASCDRCGALWRPSTCEAGRLPCSTHTCYRVLAALQALSEPGEFLLSDFSKVGQGRFVPTAAPAAVASAVLWHRRQAPHHDHPCRSFALTQLERSPLLHAGFQALDAFQAEHVRPCCACAVDPPPSCSPQDGAYSHPLESLASRPSLPQGRLPEPGSEADAADLVARAKAVNEAATEKARGAAAWWHLGRKCTSSFASHPPETHRPSAHTPSGLQAEVDEGVLRKLASTARACLNPMAAMFGGVVGQEVSVCQALPAGRWH